MNNIINLPTIPEEQLQQLFCQLSLNSKAIERQLDLVYGEMERRVTERLEKETPKPIPITLPKLKRVEPTPLPKDESTLTINTSPDETLIA